MFIRLNKYLASLGVASRRRIDDLISQHRISINNRPAIMGDKVDPEVDTIIVDKKIIPPQPSELVYIALNKPPYVLSTTKDTHSRPTVLDFLKNIKQRLYPVGRLDYNSSGLIFLTNDGNFALRLTHPRYHLPKTYLVTVKGHVTGDKLNQIRQGLLLDDGKTLPAKAEKVSQNYNQTTLKIILYQGRKRQIRRMCAALSLYVTALHRTAIGTVDIGQLGFGEWRYLSYQEVNLLIGK